MMREFVQLYHFEQYLFETVAPAYRRSGALTVFDVLAIANWKAPRARTYVHRRLCHIGSGDAAAGARRLAMAADSTRSAQARFRL
jgi:hypothetical protein